MLRNIHSLLLLVIALLMLCCGKGEPERAQTSVKAQQLCAEGRQHLVAREFVKAKVSFKAAIVEAPAEAHGRIGMIAVGVATGDRSLVDESLAALKNKGIDPTKAAPWLMALVSINPPAAATSNPVEVAKPQIAKEKSKSVTPEADPKIAGLFNAGAYEKVIDALSGKNQPSILERSMLANSYYNLEKWSEAVREYRRVLRHKPGDTAVVQYLADALMRLKRYTESMAFYRVLAESYPQKPGYWKLVGDAAIANGDDAVALAAYNKALSGGFKKAELEMVVAKLKRKIQTKKN